jgi:hypothetical protein
MDSVDPLDRRVLIKRAAALGTAGVVAPAVLSSVRSPAAAVSAAAVTVSRLTTFANAGNSSSSFSFSYSTLAEGSLVLTFVTYASVGDHLPSISSSGGVTSPTVVASQPGAFRDTGEHDYLFVYSQLVTSPGSVTTTLQIQNRSNVVIHVVEVDPVAPGSPTIVARTDENGLGTTQTINAVESDNLEVAFVALRAAPTNTTTLFVTEPTGFVSLGATTFSNETSGAGDLAGFSTYSLTSRSSATTVSNPPSALLLVWATASIEVSLP